MIHRIKALSMTQPWATLVASGHKRVETRSWGTTYAGPIAIHAAKGFPREARQICLQEPFCSVLKAIGYDIATIPAEEWKTFRLPLGEIIALVHLTRVERITPENVPHEEPERSFGNYTPGRFLWRFEHVIALPHPLPAKGARMLWQWEPPAEWQDVIRELLLQMSAGMRRERVDD
jgi:hypothetical protein